MGTDGARPGREPVFNMPGIVLAAIGLLVAIHAGRTLLAEATDLGLLFDLAFIPGAWSLALGWADADALTRAAAEAAADPDAAGLQEALARFVIAEGRFRPWTAATYALLHGSWLHVGLNCVWLAAFGTPVVRRAGALRTTILALAAALGGALAQWAVAPLSVQPLIGASGAVSGLMGAAATFAFRRRPAFGPPDWGRPPPRPAGPDWSWLRDRNVLLFLGAWFVVNLLLGVIAVPLGITEGAIAWQAHIGGLLVGLLFPLLDPGPTDPFDEA